ncbi:MAG TPA: S41 family peptidase, partial [Fimbriimonadaceae bacterium]|nr:S41 family peptidase [Fimbriimonadaceae bacterium]
MRSSLNFPQLSSVLTYMARVLVRLGLVLSVLAAFVLAPAQDMTQDQKQAVLNALGDVVMHEAYVPGVDFSKWPDLLERHKAQIDLATDVRSFGRVVNQALRDFGFSHIRLASPRATSLRGQTSTVGAGASVVPTPDGLEVRRLIEHGPARDLGLEVGDVITKIDGEKPTSVGDLDGEEGAKKSIEIKKKSGEVKTVELEIKRFSTVTEETISWPEPDTAVIRINTFSAGYGRTNVEDLMDEAAKAKYLVVDLRSNGGGSIFNLMHFLSVVLPNRTDIGTFISRRTAD